jgi:hypothetical protein
VVKSSVSLGQMIESPKLVEFDLMDIDGDEQRLRYLSLFRTATIAKRRIASTFSNTTT